MAYGIEERGRRTRVRYGEHRCQTVVITGVYRDIVHPRKVADQREEACSITDAVGCSHPQDGTRSVRKHGHLEREQRIATGSREVKRGDEEATGSWQLGHVYPSSLISSIRQSRVARRFLQHCPRSEAVDASVTQIVDPKAAGQMRVAIESVLQSETKPVEGDL